jgi:hypothetical protein
VSAPAASITLRPAKGDDPAFVDAVLRTLTGVVRATEPNDLFVVKIDSWFGRRWLAFSNKVLGAFGIAYPDLRIPPFVPNRVLAHDYFVRDALDGNYRSAKAPFRLHIHQVSSANERRKVSKLCPTSLLFWWSGNTIQTGRGALMAYLPAPEGHASWYAELTRASGWCSGNMKGITSQQLEYFQSLGNGTPMPPSNPSANQHGGLDDEWRGPSSSASGGIPRKAR